MDNNQFNNNQRSEQDFDNMSQSQKPKTNLPFNGDTKNFHANLPNMGTIVGSAPIQGQPIQNPTYIVPQMQGQMTEGQLTRSQMQQMMPKKKHTGLIIALITFFILVAGGVSAYFLFLTPEKRFERAMNKAEAAYEDSNYKQAASYYDKALSIYDDDIDAMYGKLMSDEAKGDIATLSSDYIAFSKKLLAIDDSVLEQKEEIVAEIFLISQIAYEGDADKIAGELETGLACTNDNKKILDAWVDVKLEQALALEEESTEAAIEAYERILDRVADNEEATERITVLIKELLDYYISIYAYEPAQELADTYRDKFSTINFTDYDAKIAAAKTTAEEGIPLMQKVYAAMEASDYQTMVELDFSDDTNNFLPYVNGCFMYAPDGFTEDYTGIAVGLYKNVFAGETISYYYYGNYENGVRCGHGVAFCGQDYEHSTYEIYDGEWANDMPNGYGKSGSYNEYTSGYDLYIDTIISGNFMNGYAHGTMEANLISSEGDCVYGSFDANYGEVKDVRDQYPDYDFGVGDDRIIYVILENDEVTWWLSKSLTSKIDAGYWIEK